MRKHHPLPLPDSLPVLAIVAVVLSLGFNASHAVDAMASPTALAGEWVGDPRDGCSEVIAFASDGTIRINSRDEVLIGTYVTEPVADAPSTVKVTRTIASSNGAVSCTGKVSNEAGKTRSAYAIWNGDSEIRMCFDVRGNRCFGLFRRR